MEKARSIPDPYLKIETVEKAFAEDIDHPVVLFPTFNYTNLKH